MIHASPRFAVDVVANVVICAHTPENPDDDDWSVYLEALRQSLAENTTAKILVYSLGGGPDTSQRGMINEVFQGQPYQSAVMHNSALGHLVVTALSWFNPRIKSFGLDDVDGACAHLDLNPTEDTAVRKSLQKLQTHLKLPAVGT